MDGGQKTPSPLLSSLEFLVITETFGFKNTEDFKFSCLQTPETRELMGVKTECSGYPVSTSCCVSLNVLCSPWLRHCPSQGTELPALLL